MVVRGYNHSLEELANVNYLTEEQLAMRNLKTSEQLKDCVVNVYSKKIKNAIAEMFNIELKFACDILLQWFNYKFKSERMNLSIEVSSQYKRLNPINDETKCCICDFPLDVTPKGINFQGTEMSYLDFLIKKEYSFLTNIYDEKDLEKSKNISNKEIYYDTMLLFLHLLSIGENELKSVSYFNHIFDEKLEKFLRDYCPIYEYDVEGLIENEIKTFEIKYNKAMKIPKFTMQLYSFIYDCLMDFPTTKFDEIKTVTTRCFLGKIYRILNSKVHLHHSHITGEIHGYSHDYCNWKYRENKHYVTLIGHNFLGFDIFYMVKGYRSVCWGTKDFNMGGTNLTNVNFANIGSQVKIIDTLKYYQSTLASITATADEIEKSNIKKTIQNFCLNIPTFRKFGQILTKKTRKKF